jgi:hypothetical protein
MSTCSVNPSTLTQGTNATVRVFTTGHGNVLPFAKGLPPSANISQHLPIWLLSMLAMFFLTFALLKRRRRLALAITLALLLVSVMFESACGSNSGNGTAAGNYSVNVTGVSGTMAHNVVLSLTVK